MKSHYHYLGARWAMVGMIAGVVVAGVTSFVVPYSTIARADFGNNFSAGAAEHIQTMMRPSNDGWDVDLGSQSIDPAAGPLATDLEFPSNLQGQVQAGDTFNYTQTIQITEGADSIPGSGIDSWGFFLGTRHWSWTALNDITVDGESIGFTSEITDGGGDLLITFDSPVLPESMPTLAFDLDVTYENPSRPFSLSTLQAQQTAGLIDINSTEIVSVPEPASLAMLGCCGLLMSRRAKRKKSSLK